MPEVTPPLFVNVSSFYGADELGLPYRDLIGEGVLGFTDLRVTQRGAGANLSVDVSSGTCWIMGDTTPAAQPQYRCRCDSTVNLAIATAHATNPRIDMVVAEVLDTEFDASGSRLWRLRVITGTATGGATLDNRTGAGAMPITAILLADVLVAALDTSITDAEIRDRRPFGVPGVVPPLLTDVDMVGLVPHPGLAVIPSMSVLSSLMIADNATNDLQQVAALMYLPRRIAGATRIRWKYLQGSVAMAGNYVLGLYDASGRKEIDTGSVAFTGATGTYQVRSETISATTFEAGWHYVMFGVDSSAGTLLGMGVLLGDGVTPLTPAPNLAVRSATGGVTAPTTLLGFTDTNALTASTAMPRVPLVALSVG